MKNIYTKLIILYIRNQTSLRSQYHKYQSNTIRLKIIYWLASRQGYPKTDKTFPPFPGQIPEAGPGLDRNYRKLRFPGHPIRGEEGGRWRKENFMRRIVRRIFKKSFHPLCATLPRRRGRRNARWILQFSQGVEEGFRPSLDPPSAPRGKEIRANKKATLRF